MVAIKPSQIQTLLKNPDPRFLSFLIFGPDQGLVSERASELAQVLSNRETPQGEIIRIDEPDMENNADRLGVELQTIPMFGGRKIVRTTLGRRINSQVLKSFIGDNKTTGILIIEAGSLRADESLRTTCEKSPFAASISCYMDEGRDLDTLIRDTLRQSGHSLSPMAKNLLISRLGADRALSRSEIEKLCLYAGNQKEITEEDVEKVVGDAAEMTIDRIVNATALGEFTLAINEFERALSAGENAQVIITALQRHFMRLHRIKSIFETGTQIETAILDLRPPLHFKQKEIFIKQIKMWGLKNLISALDDIHSTAKHARRNAATENMQAGQLILNLTKIIRN